MQEIGSPLSPFAMLNVSRCGWALWLLLVPGRSSPSQMERRLARALAARHLAQAALLRSSPGVPALTVGAGVDLLHASTMGALAAVSPCCRRLALSSLASSLLLAAGASVIRRNAVTQAPRAMT